MSHSRLMRSYSSDGLAYRNGEGYGVANYDHFYRQRGMDFADALEYDQDFQPRDRYYDSHFSRLGEMAANDDYCPPEKSRHVTWAPMPESYTNRNRVADNSVKSTPTNAKSSISSSRYRTLNPPCPIHGHQKTRSINESLQKLDLGQSARRLQNPISNLYDLGSSSRYPLSSYYSRLCGQMESRFLTGEDFGNPNRIRTIPRAHLNPPYWRNAGYRSEEIYPSSNSVRLGPSSFSLSPQLSFRKPKGRRSVIGLNRWNVI